MLSWIKDTLYYSLIYDDRYKYIIEGLFNTILIAFFAVILGIVIGIIVSLIRNYYDNNKKLKLLNFISILNDAFFISKSFNSELIFSLNSVLTFSLISCI